MGGRGFRTARDKGGAPTRWTPFPRRGWRHWTAFGVAILAGVLAGLRWGFDIGSLVTVGGVLIADRVAHRAQTGTKRPHGHEDG